MVSIDSSRGGYAERFGWCRDSMVKSYFDGLMGTGFAERESDAHWAAVRAGDYLFCAGSPVNAEAAAEYIRCEMGSEAVIVPEYAEDWLAALTDSGLALTAFTRYHTRLPEGGFDLEALQRAADAVNGCGCMRIVRAGEKEYAQLRDCEWENSFVANFGGMEDFLENGFAFCIYVGDELASAASTFGYYSGGYELQIATAPKFRRRGFAMSAAAAFLLECIRRGKTPHWDAAHLGSVRIAQRLGFVPDGEYTALKLRQI